MRCIDKRDPSLSRQLSQPFQWLCRFADLLDITVVERLPTRNLMTEPFSQGRAGRNILDPFIDLGISFAETTWPQATDQSPLPTFLFVRFVGQLDHVWEGEVRGERESVREGLGGRAK